MRDTPPDVLEKDGMTYKALCKSSDLSGRQGICAELDEYTDVALFRIEGRCYAVSNVCPHQHQPVIAHGVVQGCTVTCPMHGWEYNILTGEHIGGSTGLRTFGVIEQEGVVYVEMKKPHIPKWMLAEE